MVNFQLIGKVGPMQDSNVTSILNAAEISSHNVKSSPCS